MIHNLQNNAEVQGFVLVSRPEYEYFD